MLREAAGQIAAGFGHEWFRERARAGERAEELWQAFAEPGFLSVHLPEEYGGGGGGMSELVVVSEAAAAEGCPLLLLLVSAGISAELLARFGTDAQRARWLPGLCAGEKMVFAITEPDAGSNTHNLATTATRDGDVYTPARHQDLHLRRRRGTRGAGGRAHRCRSGDRTRAALAVRGRHRRARTRAHADPRRDQRAREAVPAVLRRRGGQRRPPARRGGRWSASGVLRPQPGTHPRARRSARGSVATRWRGRRSTPTSARSGESRSANTRASLTRSRRQRSSWSWRD